MRSLLIFALLITEVFSLCASAHTQCIPFAEAGSHVGEIHCVSGRITRVEHASHGVTLLNFCDESPTCPFAAVVFAHDLKRVGDVRSLEGRTVEVHGKVTAYNGRAEIIVERSQQLGGDEARIPALPKNYDVEQRGHYSAGKFSLPHASTAPAKKKQPVTYPVEIGDTGPE